MSEKDKNLPEVFTGEAQLHGASKPPMTAVELRDLLSKEKAVLGGESSKFKVLEGLTAAEVSNIWEECLRECLCKSLEEALTVGSIEAEEAAKKSTISDEDWFTTGFLSKSAVDIYSNWYRMGQAVSDSYLEEIKKKQPIVVNPKESKSITPKPKKP